MKLLAFFLTVFGLTTTAFADEPLKGGFRGFEAKDMIGLSIDLNGTGTADKPTPITGWDCVFDGKGSGREEGFGPYNNRWKLWKKQGAGNIYALAIRGTIVDFDSIAEDLLATSLPAGRVEIGDKNRNRVIRFKMAHTPGAEVDMGFTYGMAVLMFHKSQGILGQLAKLPEGSQLYITGHSQGAAIATLSHAFLYNVLAGDQENRFGLKGKNFGLKSYVFAQPKPGNWQFAMEFAQNQGNRGLAYAVNNIYDWVPQVPLSIQLASETLRPVIEHSRLHLLPFVLSVLEKVRSDIAGNAARFTNTIGQVTAEFDDRYFVEGTPGSGQGGQSLIYMPVGTVIAGVPPAGTAPKNDLLWEHHAGRYKLMVEGLGDLQ